MSANYRRTVKAVEQSKTTAIYLAAGATTDGLDEAAQAPASVTEHTTLNLESSEASPNQARTSREVDSTSSAS